MSFIHLDGFSATSNTIQAKSLIDQYGARFSEINIGLLRDIYKNHLNEANYPIPNIIRDIPYGKHPLQALDLHLPKGKNSEKLPVILFVHGGAFIKGDKSDHIIFDNVLNFFTRSNFIGVNINYRLAPEHKWPSGAIDIADSLKWIHDNSGSRAAVHPTSIRIQMALCPHTHTNPLFLTVKRCRVNQRSRVNGSSLASQENRHDIVTIT